MGGGIRKEDIEDLDIFDAIEITSDSTAVIFSGVVVTSTTAATKRVVLSGADLLRSPEELEENDTAVLAGTTGGADGSYTVDAVIDANTFTVKEAILNSTGGTAEARHKAGALRVGVDASALVNTVADNVQNAIEDLDASRAWRRHFLLMGG